MRKSPVFVPKLDIVAVDGEKIVGNTMYADALHACELYEGAFSCQRACLWYGYAEEVRDDA